MRGLWAVGFKVGAGNLGPAGIVHESGRRRAVIKFLLWCILLVLCWPLALAALVLYPLVWLLLLPFRLLGIAVGGVLDMVRGIIFLPGRLLRSI